MIAAIRPNRQPNLFLLSYHLPFVVTNLSVLPRRFLAEAMAVRRKPLAQTARRAGWIGCNLDLRQIPRSALIPRVVEGKFVAQSQIQDHWKKSEPLDQLSSTARGWAAVVLGIVERIRKPESTLQDIYEHETRVAALFPNNRNI